MKKLITLSFLLLMTSGAYAGLKKTSKTVSRVVTYDNPSHCQAAQSTLDGFLPGYDLIYKGKCYGSTLKFKIALRYVLTPSQRFKVSPQRGMSRGRCGLIARMLHKVSNEEITIKAKCNEWGGFYDQASLKFKISIH